MCSRRLCLELLQQEVTTLWWLRRFSQLVAEKGSHWVTREAVEVGHLLASSSCCCATPASHR
jgi:hypothetical protein